MNPGTPWRIILVAEGPSDPPRIRVLIDHFLKKHVGNESAPESLWHFERIDGEPYIVNHNIPKMVRASGLDRRYGPDKGDGATIRKLHQLLVKKKALSPESVLIWARDLDDGYESRREEARKTRDLLPSSMTLLLAIAYECGEAWVIAGWRPVTQGDRAKLQKWRQKLGFEPHVQPWRLSHKKDVPKSAKDIAADLFDGTDEQKEEALRLAADTDNEARTVTGLRDFCAELEAWLTRS